MNVRVMSLTCIAAIALTLVSCSSSSDPASVPTNPTVDSISPANGATNVSLVEQVGIEFSEPVDPATVDETTLTVSERGVDGFVDYDESTQTATFTPDTLYAANTWFDVLLSGDIEDLAGEPIGSDVTTSFRTGALECGNLTDHAEPNNSIATATPIEIGRTYRSLTGCDNDTDFFEFTIDETARVHPLASFKRASAENCRLYFRRSADEDYSYWGATTNDGSTLGGYFTFNPGTYYVEVLGHEGYEDWVLYDFSITTSEPCVDDGYEDNDFFGDATPIASGLHTGLRGCRVDRDYYSFHADAGDTITLTFDVQEGGVDTRQYGIYGPTLVNLELYAGWHNPITVEAVATESGTHYAFVRYWWDGYNYDMTLSVTD